jgi:hypothetical protein
MLSVQGVSELKFQNICAISKPKKEKKSDHWVPWSKKKQASKFSCLRPTYIRHCCPEQGKNEARDNHKTFGDQY